MNIFFFHFGNAPYLKYTLLQAKKWNPKANIYLLSDQGQNELGFVNTVDIYDFMNEIQTFNNVYKHMNTNSAQFEFACFVRWFILNSFIKKKKIKNLFYCDSDVMLFSDMQKEKENFENCRMTLVHNYAACTTFINDVSILDEFCNFCMRTYTDKDFYFDTIKSHYDNLKKKGMPGGVCDMTLWKVFRSSIVENPGDIEDTSSIRGEIVNDNLSTFDHIIGSSDGYETKLDRCTKNFKWIREQPYAKHKRLDMDVRFNSIHFQGQYKGLIQQYYEK